MIFASNNKGKLREIKDIFVDYEIKGLKESNIDIDVLEDGTTFYENASKKAHEIYEITKCPVIADDSGLCLDAFDGWPGVLTHRFLGENKTDHDRNEAIINKLNNTNNRKAYVICNLIYYDGEKELVGVGKLEGTITNEERGNNGFGFDSIFLLNNGKTLAELSEKEKNLVSARKLAAEDLIKKIKKTNI